MKRLPALFMALLTLCACACAAPTAAPEEESSGESAYRAGEYTGAAMGFEGELSVVVSLTDSHIDEIRVPSCPETAGIGAVVVEQLPGLIVANQTFAVDVVAGATVTSRALLKAVEEAVAASGNELTALREPPAERITPSVRVEVTEADVIVVGAGGAGLSAALAAKRFDPALRVALLEKSAAPGGNTRLASDGVNAAGSAAQQKAGVEDDFETMLNDSAGAAGEAPGDPALLEALAGDSANALDWLTEEGIALDALTALPGSSVERTHAPSDGEPVGETLVRSLTAAALDAGVSLHKNTRATSLTTDRVGEINGVIAESPGLRRLFTGRSVVLATGGFGANDKLCGSYRTLLRGLDTVSAAGSTGDGIAMAQELGAATVGMSAIVTEPTVHRGGGQLVPRALREQGAILVNREGERFADELDRDDALSDALLAQPGRSGWLLFGGGLLPLLPEALRGEALSGEDAEQLARAAGLPAEALAETILDRNAELPLAVDTEGNVPPAARLEGTIYALEVAPGIKTTLGGLLIDAGAEVIGADGAPIDGLFAAGEVTGGVHGGGALPGNPLTELLVFGRRAGEGAASFAAGPEEAAEPPSDV